jgi:two-component system, OmpR family, sensor histidine kinase RstB
MRRLYQKIYLTIVASLLVVVAVGGTFWRIGFDASPAGQALELAGELAAAALPSPDAPRVAQRDAIERLAHRLDISLALHAADGSLIASIGEPMPGPLRERRGWIHGPGGPVLSVRLPDGRAIVARRSMHHRHPALGVLLLLGTIALVVAICAFPVVRGLTGRLERLQAAVETVGGGDLAARVKVEGRDEVARLAASFNRAATRIEELVNAHRLLLANASHELRTPLSRIRLGIELFQETGDPKYKTALARDIRELDELLDEIMLASRLDAARTLQTHEDVDLLALVAEECARYEISPQGQPTAVRGDSRLLRRLIRNLLENARRHGKPPVRVDLRRDGGRAVLDVMDAGEGIPDAERERVFAPFHRLHADSTGAGLGLALVRQIARLHGGDAALVTRPDTPVCFRITLPVSHA